MDNIGILNWLHEDEKFVFESQLGDNMKWVKWIDPIFPIDNNDFEPDAEYDCD